MELNHVATEETWDSGGQNLDVLTLKDGHVLVVSDDAVVLYADRDDFDQGEAKDRPVIYRLRREEGEPRV